MSQPPTLRPPAPIRVLITGGRDWVDRVQLESELLDEVVDACRRHGVTLSTQDRNAYAEIAQGHVVFILGDCPTGADFMAGKWCQVHDVPHEIFRAKRGSSGYDAAVDAMHARNQHMVSDGKPEHFVAFWDGRVKPVSGTVDTMARCAKAGVSGRVVAPSKAPLFDRLPSSRPRS